MTIRTIKNIAYAACTDAYNLRAPGRVRKAFLPREHGGWLLFLVPLAVGPGVAGQWNGRGHGVLDPSPFASGDEIDVGSHIWMDDQRWRGIYPNIQVGDDGIAGVKDVRWRVRGATARPV